MAGLSKAGQYYFSEEEADGPFIKVQIGIIWRATSLSNRFSQIRQYSAPVDGSISAAKQRYVPTSGTYPKGFLACGTHVGVKASNKSFPDLALLTSETPCSAAAVFTQNPFCAAPVIVSKEILQKRSGEGIRSIIINSGCANAVTGQGGIEDAHSMTRTVDSQLSSAPGSTLVMSTGVIGQRLPISKILSAIPTAHSTLSSTHPSWLAAARAICTTDTFPKLLSTTFTLPSNPHTTYALAGMTKGAGMIHPNMATLLGILATDCPIPASTLSPLLTHAVNRSFNAISVDGDTSTNDTVALLANGAAGGSPITSLDSPDGIVLKETLTTFTRQLSQLVVRDGEGATKFVHIHIKSAPSFAAAQLIAERIATSPLVKTALYGEDANWGRIVCAAGNTPGIPAGTVIPERTSVSFLTGDEGGGGGREGTGGRNANGEGELKVLVKGEPEVVDEERAKKVLGEEDVRIVVDLGNGVEEGDYWFCDLSHGYVTINGDYRT